MKGTRLLTREERRIVADALRRAAAETRTSRVASSATMPGASVVRDSALANHVRELERLGGTQDHLAVEITEHEVRLERALS